jgi:hypothetical protein
MEEELLVLTDGVLAEGIRIAFRSAAKLVDMLVEWIAVRARLKGSWARGEVLGRLPPRGRRDNHSHLEPAEKFTSSNKKNSKLDLPTTITLAARPSVDSASMHCYDNTFILAGFSSQLRETHLGMI